MAVSIIPHEVLEDRQVTTIWEAAKNVSGVQTPTSVFYDSLLIRGFDTGSDTFRNGLHTYGATGSEDMAFVDRIEIAKGPTAMLYGRVQPGGLVNYVTKSPQEEFKASVQQQVGSWNSFRTVADVTGAIDSRKTLLGRAMVVHDESDSYIDYQSHNNNAVAGFLTWKPTDRFTSNLQVEYYDQSWSGRGYSGQQIPIAGNTPIKVPTNWTQNDPAIYGFSPDTVSRNFVGLDWNYKFNDDWKITNRAQYNVVDEVQTYLLASNYNATTGVYQRKLAINPFNRFNYSTNLDLNGKFKTWGFEHNLLLGFDAYKHSEDTLGNNGSYTLAGYAITPLNVFNPTYGNLNLGIQQNLYNLSANNVLWKSRRVDYGVYLQDQISFLKKWELLLGGRYDYAQTINSATYGTPAVACYPNCNGALRSDMPYQNQFSPRVGLLYKVTDEVSLYGSYSQSFGSQNAGVSFTNEAFKPQQADQYEVGAKGAFFDNKLTTSLTLFDLYLQNVLTPDTAHVGYSLAVGEVRSRGIEYDISGRITNNLSLIASYTYDDATVTKDNTLGAANTVGKYYAGVPQNSGNIWAKYDTNPGMIKGFTFGVGTYLNDMRYLNNTNTAQIQGYSRFDTMIGYRFNIGKQKISTQLNINNITDKGFYEYGGSTVTYGQPRTFMGSVKLEF